MRIWDIDWVTVTMRWGHPMCSFPFCTAPASCASLRGRRSTEWGLDLWGRMSALQTSASASSENGRGWISSSNIHSQISHVAPQCFCDFFALFITWISAYAVVGRSRLIHLHLEEASSSVFSLVLHRILSTLA